MSKRVVKAALWRYVDIDGLPQVAFFGDTVELEHPEIARGDREDVFTPAEPAAVVDGLPVPPHDVTSVPAAAPAT